MKLSTVSVAPAVVRAQAPKTVKVEIAGVSGEGTDFELTIPDAKLWNENTPNLYTARVSNGADSAEIKFGIRKVEWANKGLFVNGKETLLRGGCFHHDNGILGAATFVESEWRRVNKLKDAGFNAIRSAHNPTSRAMLEACDALGVYLMDESWDMWYNHKTKHDYAAHWRENHMADLKAMVARDFNHPSVILYSIGNEVSEPAMPEGVEAIREMVSYLHGADPNRAVTGGFNLMIITQASKRKKVIDPDSEERHADGEKIMRGMNSTLFNLITSMVGTGMNKSANSKNADEITALGLNQLDICGYNYASGRYPPEAKAHPERIVVGSETFPQTIAQNWAMVKKYPYFDILGDPNAEAFWAGAVWNKLDAPAICVQPVNHGQKPARAVWRGTNGLPSWSWAGCRGKSATVEVFYDAAVIALFLNGKKLGTAKVKNCKAVFHVKYAPGKLEAVAYGADGRELGRGALMSADAPLHIALRPEKERVRPGELCYVPITVEGANGVVESNADRKLRVSVEGGELLGFGSATPAPRSASTQGNIPPITSGHWR